MREANRSTVEHARAVLSAFRAVPGYIDDVARHMIELANLEGNDATIEVEYGDVVLHARSSSTVDEIRRHFERESRKHKPLRALCA